MGSWNVTSERIFAQASDPGAVGAGSIWTDTDANISYRRNDTNTGWIPFALDLGTAYQNLSVNSGATAQAYQASMQSLLTAQGDIIYASAANTPARLAKGTAAQALKMNSGATAPEWAAVTTVTVQRVEKSGDFTTTSTTMVDITGMTVTMPNRSGGKFLLSASISVSDSTVLSSTTFQFVDNVTAKNPVQVNAFVEDKLQTAAIFLTGSLSGQAVKVQGKTSAGTMTVYGAISFSHMESLEIS